MENGEGWLPAAPMAGDPGGMTNAARFANRWTRCNGERFWAHPAAASLEGATKKGQKTATMEVMEAMEIQPVPQDAWAKTKGYCRNGGRGNGQWRSSVPTCVQGQEDRSNVHLGSVREPMDAMEWTREPGKM